MNAEDAFRYDAFISYSHHDKHWVQGWLLPRLEQAGLRICIDFRDFEPGLPSLVNMENAVERSRKTLIVLTPEWVASEWTAFESLLIQTDDPAGRQRRMILLLLKPCQPPKRIAMLTCLDFTEAAEAEFQLQRLIEAIRAEPMPEVSRSVRDRHETPDKYRGEATAREGEGGLSPAEERAFLERELEQQKPLPAPTPPPTPQPGEGEQLLPVEIVTPYGRRVRGWLIEILRDPLWQGIGAIVAVLALVVALGTWFWPDIRALLSLPMPTATPTSAWTPAPATTRPSTLTPTPGEEVVIKIDGVVTDAGDDRFQEVDCGSSPRIEVVKILDSTGAQLQPDNFSYNWRFDPPDSHNPDKLDSKNYAIIYSVPCDRNNQTVTIEVLKGGEALYVRSVRFNIKK